jgi:hypothetical protein
VYSFVPLNQFAYFSDPLANKKPVKIRKGVVGRTGRIIPTTPIPSDRNPETMKNIFII